MKPEYYVDGIGKIPKDVQLDVEQASHWFEQQTNKNIKNIEPTPIELFETERYRFKPFENEAYNRRGFYRALSESTETEDGLRDEQQKLKAAFAVNQASFNESLNQFVKLTEQKLSSLEVRIQEETKALSSLKSKPELLRNQLLVLEEQTRAIEHEVQKAFEELTSNKKAQVEDKLNNRLDEIHAELEQLIANHSLLPEKTLAKNKQKHEEMKKFVDDVFHWYQDHRERTLERLKTLGKRKQQIEEKSGLTRQIVQFLYRAGWAAILAAGWFFASFTLSRQSLGNEDYFSFVMRRLFSIPTAMEGHSLLYVGGIALLVWCGCLTIVTLIARLCHRSIRKEKKSDKNWFWAQSPVIPGFILTRNRNGENLLPGSFYNKWLQWLPKLLLIGIAIILLSLLGPSLTSGDLQVQNLLKSLSGQFVGTLVAFAAAGLGVIYISLVIEPRWLQPASENKKPHPTWYKHIELTITFILLIVLCGLLPFFGHITDPQISTIAFFITLILGSLTMGYGIKYNGLFEEEKEQLTQLIRIERFIQKKAPVLDTSSLENPQLKQQVDQCLNDLIGLIRTKTNITSELVRGVAQLPKQGISRPKKGVLKFLKYWQYDNNTSRPLSTWITNVDRKYFRDLAFRLETCLKSLEEHQEKKAEINRQIIAIESRNSDLENSLEKNLRSLRMAKSSLQLNILKKTRRRDQLLDALKHLYMGYENELVDGYITGIMIKRNSSALPTNLRLLD